jgi:GNAT superfamily N-acetyltransferase
MNDLFVAPAARRKGTAGTLITACLERCREHGASALTWQTARDNTRARALYDRTGARPEDAWVDYSLAT